MDKDTLLFALVCLIPVAFAFFASFMAMRQKEREGKCANSSTATLL